jgi:hypothetical protein
MCRKIILIYAINNIHVIVMSFSFFFHTFLFYYLPLNNHTLTGNTHSVSHLVPFFHEILISAEPDDCTNISVITRRH